LKEKKLHKEGKEKGSLYPSVWFVSLVLFTSNASLLLTQVKALPFIVLAS